MIAGDVLKWRKMRALLYVSRVAVIIQTASRFSSDTAFCPIIHYLAGKHSSKSPLVCLCSGRLSISKIKSAVLIDGGHLRALGQKAGRNFIAY